MIFSIQEAKSSGQKKLKALCQNAGKIINSGHLKNDQILHRYTQTFFLNSYCLAFHIISHIKISYLLTNQQNSKFLLLLVRLFQDPYLILMFQFLVPNFEEHLHLRSNFFLFVVNLIRFILWHYLVQVLYAVIISLKCF